MRLSENFYLSEFEKSSTATRLGIDNTITTEALSNLMLLIDNVLQPLRDVLQRPIIVTSGYRSLELNRALKSKDTSQHIQGQAVDIECPGMPTNELAYFIRDHFPYDQLILEFFDRKEPFSGWVHVSYDHDKCRKELLTINSGGVTRGLA